MRFPPARLLLAPIRNRSKGLTVHGEAEGRTIRIDPRGRQLAHTLLHEYLHVAHREWSEKRVRRETARQWKRLTWQQKAALYQRLGRAKIEDEP